MNDKPRLLDLFCGAGGAGRGYQMAEFHVTGVDIAPQPRYAGDVFIQGDALEYVAAHGHEYDAIHASPPCQFASIGAKWKGTAHRYNNFIPATRDALSKTGKPYVIENVPGASRWLHNPVSLWGDLFGLRVVRVRLFECYPVIAQPVLAVAPVVPNTGTASRKSYSRFSNGASHITVAGHNYNVEDGSLAMGIDWMTRPELSEAIPPAYTQYIGAQLLRAITAQSGAYPGHTPGHDDSAEQDEQH